jgi:hypothetical protein
MASALLSNNRRKDVYSEPSIMAREPRSLNDLPDDVFLKILSYVGPEDLCLSISKVSENWNNLANDVELWKTLSYKCDRSSDFSRITEVRCTKLLGVRTN